MFLGYSCNINAYSVYNLGTRVVIESVHVMFDAFADLHSKTYEDYGAYLIDMSPNTDVGTGVQTPIPTSKVSNRQDFQPEKLSNQEPKKMLQLLE